jgi:hypothetical protein
MEMNDLDPTLVTGADELAALLRRVHAWADKPSYRELEARTARAAGILPGTRLKRVPLRRSTLSDVLNGRKFPRKAFLLTFVDACGIDLQADRCWEEAWDRLTVETPRAGASVEQLAQQLQKLQGLLVVAEQRANRNR